MAKANAMIDPAWGCAILWRVPAMSAPSFFEWLTTSPWANAINGPEWAFPVVQSLHFIGFAFSIGTIAIVDLRLLGLGMRRQSAAELAADLDPWTLPVSDIMQQVRAWKWARFVIVTVSGLLPAWAEPLKLYRSPAFWVKMARLALVGVHALAVRGRVYGNTAKLDLAVTAEAKLAAAISLLLWAGLVVSGRLIAYDA